MSFTALTPLPQSGGSQPLDIVWSRTTVAAGPYNGVLRTDGYGLTSINSTTPGVVWVSDDGTTWDKQSLPAGFEASDASRSRELIAAVGTVPSDGLRVPALAVSHNDGAWLLAVVDLGGRGAARNPTRSQVAVSGSRIIAVVSAGPDPGGDTDAALVFIGDNGPPFTGQVNTRFKDANLSVGSQYLWWIVNDFADGSGPAATIYGPADPIGNVDYTSLDAGWQPVAHLAGEIAHIGGRDAGEEYFAIDDGASPSSVRAIIRGTSLVMDDTIATRALNGMTWLRSCCNNAEPSIGVGEAGLAALVTNEPVGLTPTPDLSKLAIATSPNGVDWTIEPVGQLLPEQGLDVTQLIVLRSRLVVVVTERYPQPESTSGAIVLVGAIK